MCICLFYVYTCMHRYGTFHVDSYPCTCKILQAHTDIHSHSQVQVQGLGGHSRADLHCLQMLSAVAVAVVATAVIMTVIMIIFITNLHSLKM